MEAKLNKVNDTEKPEKVKPESKKDFIKVINPSKSDEKKLEEETMTDGEIWEMNLMYGIGNDVY